MLLHLSNLHLVTKTQSVCLLTMITSYNDASSTLCSEEVYAQTGRWL